MIDTKGPYFAVAGFEGAKVMRHWPQASDPTGELEKQYGPDFVERYSSLKAARRDAAALNDAWVLKQAQSPVAAPSDPSAAPQGCNDNGEEGCSEKAYEAHLDHKAALGEDPREGGWL